MAGSFVIDDRIITLLEKSMDLRSLRQTLIASNIANAETPGYKTVDLSFKKALKASMSEEARKRSGTSGLEGPERTGGDLIRKEKFLHLVKGLKSRPDGNNVDMDREMLELWKNTSGYNLSTQLLMAKFRLLTQAVKGGVDK